MPESRAASPRLNDFQRLAASLACARLSGSHLLHIAVPEKEPLSTAALAAMPLLPLPDLGLRPAIPASCSSAGKESIAPGAEEASEGDSTDGGMPVTTYKNGELGASREAPEICQQQLVPAEGSKQAVSVSNHVGLVACPWLSVFASLKDYVFTSKRILLPWQQLAQRGSHYLRGSQSYYPASDSKLSLPELCKVQRCAYASGRQLGKPLHRCYRRIEPSAVGIQGCNRFLVAPSCLSIRTWRVTSRIVFVGACGTALSAIKHLIWGNPTIKFVDVTLLSPSGIP